MLWFLVGAYLVEMCFLPFSTFLISYWILNFYIICIQPLFVGHFMNTSKLKKFAQSTRRKLIGLVSARLDYVLGADSAELRGLEKPLAEVRQLMDQLGREELLEKVAYTWFNRFMALRFMDVNDYHTFRLRVLSPVEGHSQPEILEQAKAGNVDDELKLDRGALEH